jgi:hypothetical protein
MEASSGGRNPTNVVSSGVQTPETTFVGIRTRFGPPPRRSPLQPLTRTVPAEPAAAAQPYRSRRANPRSATTPTNPRYTTAHSHSSGPAGSAPPNGPRSIARRVKPIVSEVSALSAAW